MLKTAAILLVLAACGKHSAPPSAGDPQPSDPAAAGTTTAATGPSAADEARTTFDTICAVCHGKDGRGDGPGAASLNPKPRNYTDKAWQASVTDDQIAKTILMGGAAVGKSPVMPAQPQLKEKPAVVTELIKIIRGFGK
jgi:cytochrome c553